MLKLHLRRCLKNKQFFFAQSRKLNKTLPNTFRRRKGQLHEATSLTLLLEQDFSTCFVRFISARDVNVTRSQC